MLNIKTLLIGLVLATSVTGILYYNLSEDAQVEKVEQPVQSSHLLKEFEHGVKLLRHDVARGIAPNFLEGTLIPVYMKRLSLSETEAKSLAAVTMEVVVDENLTAAEAGKQIDEVYVRLIISRVE